MIKTAYKTVGSRDLTGRMSDALSNVYTMLNASENEKLERERLAKQEERQAIADARQARMDALATPGTPEYGAAQIAKAEMQQKIAQMDPNYELKQKAFRQSTVGTPEWEEAQKARWSLEQQSPEAIKAKKAEDALKAFRDVRTNAMQPVAMNEELVARLGNYNKDISGMTPQEQTTHFKMLEDVGNKLGQSVRQPTTEEAYQMMGQSPLMKGNTLYQDELANMKAAKEVAMANRVTEAQKGKQTLLEKLATMQSKGVTAEDRYKTDVDDQKYLSSLRKTIQGMTKDDKSFEGASGSAKIDKLVQRAYKNQVTPEQLVQDNTEAGWFSGASTNIYIPKDGERVAKPGKAASDTSVIRNEINRLDQVIKSGGNSEPAKVKYDNDAILARLNGETTPVEDSAKTVVAPTITESGAAPKKEKKIVENPNGKYGLSDWSTEDLKAMLKELDPVKDKDVYSDYVSELSARVGTLAPSAPNIPTENISNKSPRTGLGTLFVDLPTNVAKEVKRMTYDRIQDYFKGTDKSSAKAVVGLLNNSAASALEIAGSLHTATKMFTDWLVFGESKGPSVFTKNAEFARETAVKALSEAGVKNPTTQQIALVGSELLMPGSALIKAFSKGPKAVKIATDSIIKDPAHLIPPSVGKARTFTAGGKEVVLPPKMEQIYGY